MTNPQVHGDIAELLAIMKRLRNPDGGCPWDLAQNFATIAPYTIEEAYEVASAIEAQDWSALKDELGDLLFQVVFHAQMASEQGLFGFRGRGRRGVRQDGAAASACVRRRHGKDAAAVTAAWDEIKRREREAKPVKATGLLDDVPRALPALMRAIKLQNRAAEVGFDWPNAGFVTDKIAEESRELAEAASSGDAGKTSEEFGDLLFAMANLARHLKLDPEDALRAANAKFVRRFKAIEAGLQAKGKKPEDASLDEMEALWQEAKKAEAAVK